MELEDQRENAYQTKVRCWVVDSKFDALEPQGSAASRDLHDAVCECGWVGRRGLSVYAFI